MHVHDPVQAILARTAEQPDHAEAQTLVKAVLTLLDPEDSVSVGELCALSADALDLIEALARAYAAGQCGRELLQGLADKLRSVQAARLPAAA